MLPALLLLPLLLLASQPASAAHANFHVQYPWLTRSAPPPVRPQVERYNPFCGEITHNPQRFARLSRTFLSFSGHPGDRVSARYTRHRAPRGADDFPHVVLPEVAIGEEGQLCVNVTLPFETEEGEWGVLYFQAVDPESGGVGYHCSDVRMVDVVLLPEGHPAMCAKGNETLIPMPDEYL
ncbi:hypothetical protein CALVIDRAFT_485913 [Calocera viscosa TUFC12733]|uniref:Copper acquisition factor BIM1-like domain-containing protein n=1 Tax=Calocera viscosa (strain TUFC12733) TaxID=1330018 RepID=A0A167J7V4_CALVF|nr:hypothetical protein CALVIDRAFT_485913 [Calocera viscosa TUFC12733]